MAMQMTNDAQRMAHPQTNDTVRKVARAGLATKGAVYMILGALTIDAATSGSAHATGSQGAIKHLGQQSFGQILLVIAGIGLFAYALWRFVQAAVDPDNKGLDAKGLLTRIGYVLSGLVHVSLGVMAFQLMSGGGQGSGGSKTWLAQLLAEPFGAFAVGALGVFVIAVGLKQLGEAFTQSFKKKMRMSQMSETERKLATFSARAGLAARGVVFPIMGYSLIQAALSSNAGLAKGIGPAMTELAQSTGGLIVLIVVAAGLFAYGIYQVVLAKYRRFGTASAA